jgi:hypothetical protein
MKRQNSFGPHLGKLVHQLPGVVSFAYDIHFRIVIARWKGIVKAIHLGVSIRAFLLSPNVGSLPLNWGILD